MEESKVEHGSITVEATLVFPIVILILVMFMFCFEYLRAEYLIAEAMTDVADEICEKGIPIEYSLNFIQEVKRKREGEDGERENEKEASKNQDAVFEAVSEIVSGYLSEKALEKLTRARIDEKNGGRLPVVSDISFSESRICRDGWVQIVCDYELINPVGIFSIPKIRIVQEVKERLFTGHEIVGAFEINQPENPEDENEENDEDDQEEEDDELYVYITPYGEVYHKTTDCPSLRLTISEVLFSEVPKLRNENGAKYYACEHCTGKQGEKERVFITTDGDRYHAIITCSGLKRTISKVKLSEAENERRACKRCNK